VTSDSGAIEDIYEHHDYVKTAEQAACVALKQGRCDINSGPVYWDHLNAAVAAGLCSTDDVNEALTHTLTLRFQLGLFDPIDNQPYVLPLGFWVWVVCGVCRAVCVCGGGEGGYLVIISLMLRCDSLCAWL